MACQIPADCLYEIFEHLKNKCFERDIISLHSCLLVNRFWCEVAVKILWRDILSFEYDSNSSSKLVSTLIACLPNESKNLLYKNEIFIPTPTSNPPLFNYISFIKVLSIFTIDRIIENALNSQDFDYNKYLITQELLKIMMNQISPLKTLDYNFGISKVPFTYFPGAENCLADLSVFSCNSDIYPEFFYQLSQICHNIQSLTIIFEKSTPSNGLKKLISLQNHLKYLRLDLSGSCEEWIDIIPALIKHHNTLTHLCILGHKDNQLSFITSFINLQELILSSNHELSYELQHVTFPNLKILRFPLRCPKKEILMKFLEKNGKNLSILDIGDMDEPLSLLIIQFCPNLKEFHMGIEDDDGMDIDIIKTIFKNCQGLESIKIICVGSDHQRKERIFKEIFEAVTKYSPESFYEFKLYAMDLSGPFPEDLESFLISWGNRKPQEPLSLIVVKHSDDEWYDILEEHEENVKVIRKYIKLGIIKNFGFEIFYDFYECFNNYMHI